MPCPVAPLLFYAPGLFCCRSARYAIALPIAGRNERLMTANTFLPAFASLSFPSEDFMPNRRIQLRQQGKNRTQEIIAVHSPIVDRPICRIGHTTKPILRQTLTVRIIRALLLCKLFHAAQDMLIVGVVQKSHLPA